MNTQAQNPIVLLNNIITGQQIWNMYQENLKKVNNTPNALIKLIRRMEDDLLNIGFSQAYSELIIAPIIEMTQAGRTSIWIISQINEVLEGIRNWKKS